ncbi:MAG: ATP-binding cassette domain-containing protein [Microlunatus sp.]|nr:ATP-binding cassette domain-containing protein [Microlunatus sp.]
MIKFDEVSKEYPDGTVAVNSVSLSLPSRKITTFVGPSGCGKTTSLKMINRLIEPTRGRILIDDQDVTRIDAPKLRRGIGYVIQQGGLFPNKTVLDNITTVPRLLGVTNRAARRRAAELLEIVGLSADLARRYPTQLSGGQQQRVGVARALAADPPILLMDEPFSAVDPVVRLQLQDELLRIQADLSKTIVFVTHDIDEAIKLGDLVAVMRVGGTLAQLATPAELLARPADTFVASFIGKDRGYRALGFTQTGKLPLTTEATIMLGQTAAEARKLHHMGWLLATDTNRRPLGWIDTDALASLGDDQIITADLLNLGGTLAATDGTLRELLDAALSSPSRRGVVVNPDQTIAGTVTASAALTQIDAQTNVREETPSVADPPADHPHVIDSSASDRNGTPASMRGGPR